MAETSLADALRSAASPVEYLRGWGWGRFTRIPEEYTHWMEEQRAWRERAALMDLSYHMADLSLEGPDAIAFLERYSVNDYTGFVPGKAKQLVVANPAGEFIGDAILFALEDDSFLAVGPAAGLNWLEYQAETGDWDVDLALAGRPVSTGRDPDYFRFQVQGPEALGVVQRAVDGPLPETAFFSFDRLEIAGAPVRALRHGMAGEAGYELFGPYDEGAAVKEALLEAGESVDIRRVGSAAYTSVVVGSGWVSLPVPAIYDHPAMADYREWLPAKRGTLSIGGSFQTDDISDYYVTPAELGYGRFVDRDRDFVGAEAVRAELDDPPRRKVTLVWDAEDAVGIYGSLFGEGPTGKFMALPSPRWAACQYHQVYADGEPAGVTAWTSYTANERALLSLALVDSAHAEPGTAVELDWGEPADSPNPMVERHEIRRVGATVAPSPYVEDRR